MTASLIAVALLAVACGSGDGEAADVPHTAPVITPGGTTTGSVDVGGTTIEYAATVPNDFIVGDTAPLLLAFPPGGQDIGLARRFVGDVYAPEANTRGWVVVSPAAPDGTLFFQGSEALVPLFLDWVETWVVPEGGAPHVVGVSNGGLSSFRYAGQNPERVLSITTFPGHARTEADEAALDGLADIPIRLYVGGDDTPWIGPAEATRDRLVELGADVQLTVFPGEGHVPSSLTDGKLIFEDLDSFREG